MPCIFFIFSARGMKYDVKIITCCHFGNKVNKMIENKKEKLDVCMYS